MIYGDTPNYEWVVEWMDLLISGSCLITKIE